MSAPSLEAAKITIQLLDRYKDDENIESALKLNYVFSTPEEFLQEHFAQHEYSEELQDEIAEFFFKISKYRKYLTIIENEFLNGTPSDSKKTTQAQKSGSSNETSINLVFLYLFIIELNEFTKNKVEELVKALNEKKGWFIMTLLRKSDTKTKLYNLGCEIWDVEYVKEILENFLNKNYLNEVYESITSSGLKPKKVKKKELTVPIGPKCLSYPRKFIPPPKEMVCTPPEISHIPVLIRANPIPYTTYVKPLESEEIERIRLKNSEEAKKKYLEAQKNAFRVAKAEKSEKFKKLVEKVEMERMSIPVRKTSFNKMKTTEVQQPKKTAAVILREGARLLKLEQKEIKRYEDLASGGFNTELIAEWEKEIKEEDFRKHMEDIEKKHIEGLLSYEEALIAKQKCLKRKKEKAIEFRREKENWMMELEMWRKEEQMRIQESFEKGKAVGKGAKEAVEHIKEEKHKIALETMEESRTLKEKWLKEKEQDLQRKVQLIKEIKALQALGVIRRKQTDFTETANLGLLYEMSLAELKERLFLLKIEVQEELEKRRAKVKMKRECRKEIIENYQELIESHQRIVQKQKEKSERETEGKKVKNKTRLTRSSSSLESLRQKLYEKRRERIKEQILC